MRKSKRGGSWDYEACCDCHRSYGKHAGSTVYGLGFIGSAIYYISNASGFWAGVLGLLKAVVWPAFLVYHALKFFGI